MAKVRLISILIDLYRIKNQEKIPCTKIFFLKFHQLFTFFIFFIASSTWILYLITSVNSVIKTHTLFASFCVSLFWHKATRQVTNFLVIIKIKSVKISDFHPLGLRIAHLAFNLFQANQSRLVFLYALKLTEFRDDRAIANLLYEDHKVDVCDQLIHKKKTENWEILYKKWIHNTTPKQKIEKMMKYFGLKKLIQYLNTIKLPEKKRGWEDKFPWEERRRHAAYAGTIADRPTTRQKKHKGKKRFYEIDD